MDAVTDIPATRVRTGTRRQAAMAALLMSPMLFVAVTVNYWVYHAHTEFAIREPERALLLPTVSEAISVGAIGRPFGFWISMASIAAVFGVIPIIRLYFLSARALPQTPRRTRTILDILVPVMLAAQVAASIGIAMASLYRFPRHNETHMLGCYIFYPSQTILTLCLGIACLCISMDPQARATLAGKGLVEPRTSRWRAPFAFVCVACVVGYVVLFVIKDYDFGSWNGLIRWAYVTAEPALFFYFLLVPLSYIPEIYRSARGRIAAPSIPVERSVG